MMRVLIIEGPGASGSAELARALAGRCAVGTTSSRRKIRLSLSAIPDVVVMTGVPQERQAELRRVLRQSSFLMPVIVLDRAAEGAKAGWRLMVESVTLDPQPLVTLLELLSRIPPGVAEDQAREPAAAGLGMADVSTHPAREAEATVVPLLVAGVRSGRRRSGADAMPFLERASGARR